MSELCSRRVLLSPFESPGSTDKRKRWPSTFRQRAAKISASCWLSLWGLLSCIGDLGLLARKKEYGLWDRWPREIALSPIKIFNLLLKTRWLFVDSNYFLLTRKFCWHSQQKVCWFFVETFVMIFFSLSKKTADFRLNLRWFFFLLTSWRNPSTTEGRRSIDTPWRSHFVSHFSDFIGPIKLVN